MTSAESSKPDQQNGTAIRAGDCRSWLPSRRAIVAAMVLMIPWAMIAIPCLTAPPSGGMQWRHFGWPLVHCWTIETDASVAPDDIVRVVEITELIYGLIPWLPVSWFQQNGHQVDYPLWSNPDHWRYWGSPTAHIQWHWGPLLVNAGIGLGIFVTLSFFLEWRIRTRGGLFRFRLMDVLVIALVLAYPLASLGNTLAGSTRDEKLLAELRGLGVYEPETQATLGIPVWLDRLFDNRAMTLASQLDSQRSLERVTSIDLSSMKWNLPIDNAQFKRIAEIISSFDRLEKVSLSFGGGWASDLLERIDPGHVRELHVAMGSQPLTETELAGLSHCNRVVRLDLTKKVANTRFQILPSIPDLDQRLEFLDAIRPMTRLQELNLHWINVHEQDCPALLELKSLKTVTCLSITPKAREILQKSKSGLKIICNPG